MKKDTIFISFIIAFVIILFCFIIGIKKLERDNFELIKENKEFMEVLLMLGEQSDSNKFLIYNYFLEKGKF